MEAKDKASKEDEKTEAARKVLPQVEGKQKRE